MYFVKFSSVNKISSIVSDPDQLWPQEFSDQFPYLFSCTQSRDREREYNNTHISRSTTLARAWFNWFFHSFVLGSNACWQCITLETPHLVSLSALRRRLWTKMDIATRISRVLRLLTLSNWARIGLALQMSIRRGQIMWISAQRAGNGHIFLVNILLYSEHSDFAI